MCAPEIETAGVRAEKRRHLCREPADHQVQRMRSRRCFDRKKTPIRWVALRLVWEYGLPLAVMSNQLRKEPTSPLDVEYRTSVFGIDFLPVAQYIPAHGP